MRDQSAEFGVKPIGVIHSPFTDAQGTPIQSVYAADREFEVDLFPQYVDGLRDLAGFEELDEDNQYPLRAHLAGPKGYYPREEKANAARSQEAFVQSTSSLQAGSWCRAYPRR